MLNSDVYHVSSTISENKRYFDENIRSLSEREVSWLQAYLTKKIGVSFISMGSTNLHEELINQLAKIDNFKSIVYDARSEMSYALVPQEYFSLLEGSLRAQIFFLNFLISEYDYTLESIKISRIMKDIYHYFDKVKEKTTINNNIRFLNNILFILRDIVSKDNYTKWLKNEEGQVVWTTTYLNEKKLIVSTNDDRLSEMELTAIILASLDLIDCPKYTEIIKSNYLYKVSPNKELVIDKMKRAWSQQKYRDAGKTKRPYHLPLTKKTEGRLAKMAQVQGLSETAMLDILINRFYEMEYVDVDGKDLY
ncbi:hypothetical protein ACTXJ5_04665 [Psychrobacter alimentarius]|uniref:hypothetical protein n=1 Tax=Psychrobacter alimentarius TaxID=261164 RepID=UPI003FCFEFA1